jgi:hypothetical protein
MTRKCDRGSSVMTSVRSDGRTPAIGHRNEVGTSSVGYPLLAIEMKLAHPQWRRWRNLAFLEILWCDLN